ncbi:hypothetical protein Tco_1177948 [Tanacetum coccineum]
MWFGEEEESFLHNVNKEKETAEELRAENTGLRAEASKMLWADSVSTPYLIYRIPYIPIGLRILEEEWRGKDTSLAYLKESQVVLVDILENLIENDSIAAEHGLSSEITQSPEDHMKNTLKTEHPPIREALRFHRYEGPAESSGLRLPAGKKASQKLWMFKVKEEHDGSKRYKARLVLQEPSYVGALNDTSTQHKSEGFLLAGQKENLECILKQIVYGLIQAPRLWLLKVDDMLVAGSDVAEFNKPKWQLPLMFEMKDKCSEKFLERKALQRCSPVGNEREVEVLRSFNWPSSELITEDDVLPERGYSQFNDVSSGYLISKVS